MDGDTSEEEDLQSQEPPPPPPRVDSLQPSSTPAPHSTNGEGEEENLYEPRHWRQQIYESWTPGYVFPPAPSQPPPKPPVSHAPDKKEAPSQPASQPASQPGVRERRQENYEVWTPTLRKEPSP